MEGGARADLPEPEAVSTEPTKTVRIWADEHGALKMRMSSGDVVTIAYPSLPRPWYVRAWRSVVDLCRGT
jgi:hypothetical protein